METLDYGKLIWTDDVPKSPAWKTGLLLMFAVLILNLIRDFSLLYLGLAIAILLIYGYFSIKPGGVGVRMKLYEKGVFASFAEKRALAGVGGRFVAWGEIKTLKLERKGILSKKNVLHVSMEAGEITASVENKESLVSECKKLGKEISS
jgi:hypothetical protein